MEQLLLKNKAKKCLAFKNFILNLQYKFQNTKIKNQLGVFRLRVLTILTKLILDIVFVALFQRNIDIIFNVFMKYTMYPLI